MLKLRTALHKKINKRGFTLAELLVVVAIIAILVAVSLLIFSGKLEEARKNTDLANVRAAKAAVAVEYLTNGIPDYWYYDANNGTLTQQGEGIKGYNQKEQTSGFSNKKIKPKEGIISMGIVTNSGEKGDKTNYIVRWLDKSEIKK